MGLPESPLKSRMVCVMVAAVCWFVTACPHEGPEPFAVYFDREYGVEVPLVLDTLAIVLELDPELSQEEVDAVLATEPLLAGPVYDGSGSYSAVDVEAGTTEDALLALLERLNATPGVLVANPVVSRHFRDVGIRFESTICVAVLREFIVEFPADTSGDAIAALNEELGAEGDLLQATDDRIVYRLRPLHGRGQSSLDLANQYHQHELTSAAYPQFGPFCVS